MEKKHAVGVDIGGSHISCAAIDLDNRKIISETLEGRPVDNKASAGEIIERWSEALSGTIRKAGAGNIRGIGFAMPGPFDYVNGICLIKGVPKYEKLYGTNIAGAISSSLNLPGSMQIRFMNDASSFAVGEAWAGRASGSRRSMAVTLGTGLGSAFIDDRVPVVTGDRVPDLGCVYHINYRDGIADDYFSTRWFIKRYKELTGHDAAGVKEIYEAALRDDGLKQIFLEFGSSFGSFIAPFLNKFGAEVLVIGGNISQSYDLFGGALERELKDNDCSTKPYTSDLMEDAALLGSAYLLDDSFWNSVKDLLQYM